MFTLPDLASMAGIIQLAVAPVFLLAGIGAMLGVMSGRLGRITDRARVLETRKPHIKDENKQQQLRTEQKSLWRRAKAINRAITLCTSSALFVCLVIMVLFVGEFTPLQFNLPVLVGLLFITAMALLTLGLCFFLREIYIATKTMRLSMNELIEEAIES